MLTCVVCEDESSQRKKIVGYLKDLLTDLNVTFKILEFSSGEELLQNYPEEAELIFLDIQMAEMTGLEVAKEIRTFNQEVDIIFITGLITYMQDGYEVNARRYLVKPLDYATFKEKVEPCVTELIKKQENYVWIRRGVCDYKIRVDQILYIATGGRRVRVHTTKGEYETYTRLCTFEKELERDSFFRCHEAFLINLKYVESIGKNSVSIGERKITVSRFKMKALREELAKVIGE